MLFNFLNTNFTNSKRLILLDQIIENLLHRWINIWNGDFKISKKYRFYWNIVRDLGFDVRYFWSNISRLGIELRIGKKKITLSLYLYHELSYFMSFHELNWTLYSGFGKKI